MAAYGFVVPILQGKVEQDRALAAAIAGRRKAEYVALRARLGNIREQDWLQRTPIGTMEGEDIERTFRELAQPLPGPPNEQAMDFHFG